MTLQQLEYIVAVDNHRNFVRAADSCGVTQSTLSLMIKKLEEELDVRIFDRDAHPVTPTRTGQKVIDKARSILYGSNQLIEMTRSQKQLETGELRIGMISTVASVLMPGMLTDLKDNHPKLKVLAQEMSSMTIKEKLHKTELDMGIITSPVSDEGLLEIPLYNERFLAYINPDDPRFELESIESKHVFDKPIWLMRDGLRLVDKSIMKEKGLSYNNLYEGGRVSILIRMVNASGGMTIIPESHKSMLLYSHQNRLKPIVNPVPERTLSLVIRKDYIHEKVLNIVVDSIKKLIPEENIDPMVRGAEIHL